ncbi:MAG: hypothetical protein ACTHPS_00335 [Streptosporangiaceae bacterium]
MGSGRAYTYDWIENLFGLSMHSADEILPQFQDVKLGGEIPPRRPQPRRPPADGLRDPAAGRRSVSHTP